MDRTESRETLSESTARDTHFEPALTADQAREATASAGEAYGKGQLDQAWRYAASAASLPKGVADEIRIGALAWRGFIEFKQTRHSQCQATFSQVIDEDVSRFAGRVADALYFRGLSFAAENNAEAALADWGRVIEGDEPFADNYRIKTRYDRSDLFAKKTRFDEAQRDCDVLLLNLTAEEESYVDRVYVRALQAKIYCLQADYAGAIRIAGQILHGSDEVIPEIKVGILALRGESLLATKRMDKAWLDVESAFELIAQYEISDDAQAQARLFRSSFFYSIRPDPHAALADCEWIIHRRERVDPKNVELALLFKLKIIEIGIGDPVSGLAAIDEIIQGDAIRSREFLYRISLSRIVFQRDSGVSRSTILEQIDHALETYSDQPNILHARFLLMRGALLFNNRRQGEAIKDFERALDCDSQSAETHAYAALGWSILPGKTHPRTGVSTLEHARRAAHLYSIDTWRVSGSDFNLIERESLKLPMWMKLAELLPEPLLLWRLKGQYGIDLQVAAAQISPTGQVFTKLSEIERQTSAARFWLDVAEQMPESVRCGMSARVELLFGDAPGALIRFDEETRRREDEGRSSSVSLWDWLTRLRAAQWSVIEVASDLEEDKTQDERDFEALGEEALAAVREALAQYPEGGRLRDDDLRAAILISICVGELDLAEVVWGDASHLGGIGYLGWWLAQTTGDDEVARQRLREALAEDQRLTREHQRGWLPLYRPEPIKTGEGYEAKQSLMNELYRSDMTWAFVEVWGSEDLLALAEEDAALRAWLNRVGGGRGQLGADAYAQLIWNWTLDREAIEELQQSTMRDRWREADELYEDIDYDWQALNMPCREDLSGQALGQELGGEILRAVSSQVPYQIASVLKVLWLRRRLSLLESLHLAMYYAFLTIKNKDQYKPRQRNTMVCSAAISVVCCGLTLNGGSVGVLALLSALLNGPASILIQQAIDKHHDKSGGQPISYQRFLELLEGEFSESVEYQRLRDLSLQILKQPHKPS